MEDLIVFPWMPTQGLDIWVSPSRATWRSAMREWAATDGRAYSDKFFGNVLRYLVERDYLPWLSEHGVPRDIALEQIWDGWSERGYRTADLCFKFHNRNLALMFKLTFGGR